MWGNPKKLSSNDSPSSCSNVIQGVYFTDREVDVLACLLCGRVQDQAIANKLQVTSRGAEAHVRNIMRKLQCNARQRVVEWLDRTEAATLLRDHYHTLDPLEASPGGDAPKNPLRQLETSRLSSWLKKIFSTRRGIGAWIIAVMGICTLAAILLLAYQLVSRVVFSPQERGAEVLNPSKPQEQENLTQSPLATALPIRSDFLLPEKELLLERQGILSTIDQKFKTQASGIPKVVLVGIGGAGKTVLARQYARGQQTSLVWEIHAETPASLLDSFKNLAYELATTSLDQQTLRNIQEIRDEPDRAIRLISFVKKKLKDYGEWLLLYDNVSSFESIHAFFPKDEGAWGRGRVLLTTCNDNIKNAAYLPAQGVIEVGELSSPERHLLFEKIIQQDQSAWQNYQKLPQAQKQAFWEHIPPFPLDIQLAAFFMKSTHMSYQEYLSQINDQEDIHKEVLKDTIEYTKSRYGLVSLALKQILEKDQNYQGLLLLISYLYPQDIPKQLLASYTSPHIMRHFLHDLKQVSFVLKEQEETFSLHSSIQDVMRLYIEKMLGLPQNSSFLQNTTTCFVNYLVTMATKEHWSKMHQAVQHAQSFLQHLPENKLLRAAVLSDLGLLHYRLFRYKETRNCCQKALDLLKNTHAQGLIAKTITSLGVAYRGLGDYANAERCFQKSIALLQHIPHSLEKARAYIDMSSVYVCIGQYAKAHKMMQYSEEALKTTPEESYYIHFIYHYWGVLYRITGRFSEAIHYFEKALAIRTEFYGNDHIRVAWTLLYLGHTYDNAGDYKKARQFLEEGIRIYQRELTKEHIDYAFAMGFLGYFYRTSGQYEQAEDILERSVSLYRTHYGMNSLETACIQVYLAQLYDTLERYTEAQDLFDKSLKIYRQHFGSDHLRVGWILIYAGRNAKNLGDYKKAQEYLQKSLAIHAQWVGNTNTEYARVLKELGDMALRQSKLIEADKYLTQAEGIFKAKNHAERYAVLELLAELYQKQAAYISGGQKAQRLQEKAQRCLTEALAITRAMFPPKCPHIKRIQEKLGKATPSRISVWP